MTDTATTIFLQPKQFRERETPLLADREFTCSTFRYESGVCALRLKNSRGEIVMLPYQGQQIWSASFDGRDLTEDSSAPAFNLSYSRQLKGGGGFSLAASRDLSPTGEGDVVDTTGLTASLNLPPRPKWQLSVAASAYRSRSPSGETARGDETSYSIGPSLRYRIAEHWGLSLGYLFSYEDLSDTGDDAVSNAVYLNLSWAPRPWDL